MSKALFNDTTDVSTAYIALDDIVEQVKGTEEYEAVYSSCCEINKILNYLMDRLRHSERERFGDLPLQRR